MILCLSLPKLSPAAELRPGNSEKLFNKNGAASQEVTHSAVAVYGLIISRNGSKGN
ncbi:hypothetical protein FAEPRAA2165_02486 [Faecalibacterium duncaniae]|uniref:Uncharacterized protein n=1 Tax=Faecalibacterium duncaniae (strain DSM 17677 / JCM 31915 / A2-165) TaxID=411483 RepID=C7H851_FAED2|nr:hypothetical protein FAEPRAA2165_02486 [Faecalibacterium duncaniae]